MHLPEEELKKLQLPTLCVHGAGGGDERTGALSTPIFQSSTFSFHSAEEGADIFAGRKKGYFYTRLGNPTQDALQNVMAFLEGGEASLAFASGMAAIACVTLDIAKAGDNIVSSQTLYGGSFNFFSKTLPDFKIKARFVDATDIENIKSAIDKKTKMIYLETPCNPTNLVIDIRKCAEIAKENKISLVVDNTFATPYLQKPLKLGADVVIHSATKYLGGHGDTVAGIAVGTEEFMEKVRFSTLMNMGGIISPLNSWLILRGIKTLAVRMDKHCENAMYLAKYLRFHPKVKTVSYPGLSTHPQHELAKQQMKDFGGMIAFELKGGYNAGRKLMDAVNLFTLAVSLGDVDSLIQHPASMTHSEYSEEDLLKAGIPPSLVRISAGIEDVKDLENDLEQALSQL